MSKLTTKTMKLSDLHLNTGQIDGVPKNPRFIKDERFEALKKSVYDSPEMLEIREVVAYDNHGELVVILGNMRYRAMKELGIKECPVKVLPEETPVEKLKAYIIKDNVAFGSNDWDALANEWDTDELVDWGMECDFLVGDDDESSIDELMNEEPSEKKEKDVKIEVIIPFDMSDELDTIKDSIKELLAYKERVKVK